MRGDAWAGGVRCAAEGEYEMADRTARERTRLAAAAVRVWDHYGVEAASESLVLDDPPLTTRVVRCGEGPPTVLLQAGA